MSPKLTRKSPQPVHRHSRSTKIADFTACKNHIHIQLLAIAYFLRPGLPMTLQSSISGAQNEPKIHPSAPRWLGAEPRTAQRHPRGSFSALRTSWGATLCSYESWDRALQHLNNSSARIKNSNRQIWSFLSRGTQTSAAPHKASLTLIYKTCEGWRGTVSDFRPTHANGQKSKIDHRTKRVLPNASCLPRVADWKLGSRMDAPIFDFGRVLKFHWSWTGFIR